MAIRAARNLGISRAKLEEIPMHVAPRGRDLARSP
jgi:hypothetical protein